MAPIADPLDLGGLALAAGEARALELELPLPGLRVAGRGYAPDAARVAARVDVDRTPGGYSLRLRYEALVRGECTRCLGDAAMRVEVDAREVDQAGGGDELRSPYVEGDLLDLGAWARDALALELPAHRFVCREDCLGLCPECGVDLNDAPPGHGHERAPDPRWAALRELGA